MIAWNFFDIFLYLLRISINFSPKQKEKSIWINYLDYVVYHFQLYLHFKYLTQKIAFDFVNPTKFALIKYDAQVLEDFNW